MTQRVLLVSDVRVVREGLNSVLAQRDGVEVIGDADMRQAREQGARLQPDVVLFDAARRANVAFVKTLVSAVPDARVVAFGVKETDQEILALAAAGAAGYVRDGATSGDIINVLKRLMCGELPCSAHAAASLYREVAALSQRGHERIGVADAQASAVPLSRRELQIAQLIDEGLTNKQIARKLGIEAATVKNHVHNMCEKLKVHRRGAAAARVRALATHAPRAGAARPLSAAS